VPWLTADESWGPPHTKPETRKALKAAKDARCDFYPLDHGFGDLRCTVHPEDPCTETVRRTSGGDESGAASAKYVLNMLRKCESRLVTDFSDPDPRAKRAIVKVERLVEAAYQFRIHESMRNRSEQQLEAACAAIDPVDAESLEDDAIQSEAKSAAYEANSRKEAERFGFTSRWPPEQGSRELEALARAELERIEGMNREDSVTERITSARERLDALD
jgi:hypothetical protein